MLDRDIEPDYEWHDNGDWVNIDDLPPFEDLEQDLWALYKAIDAGTISKDDLLSKIEDIASQLRW